jgi:Family of unknown function (DUF6090)
MKKILETLRNKWAEYLLEILVIMIGILGAFALNNWNEVRKQRIDEIGLLKDLKTDFEIKTKQLQEAYEISKKLNESTIQFIMSQLNNQEDTFDMYDVLHLGDFYPISSHINSLEVALDGNTVNIFRSDSLVIMLRNLKVNLVNLENDAAYIDDLWTNSLVPFLNENGLNIHRFALIHKGIAPDPEILKGIDMKDFANEVSNLTSIQVEWLKKQKAILEDMSKIIRLVQVELER